MVVGSRSIAGSSGMQWLHMWRSTADYVEYDTLSVFCCCARMQNEDQRAPSLGACLWSICLVGCQWCLLWPAVLEFKTLGLWCESIRSWDREKYEHWVSLAFLNYPGFSTHHHPPDAGSLKPGWTGDTVWWHCDLIHAVEGVHGGQEDAADTWPPQNVSCCVGAEECWAEKWLAEKQSHLGLALTKELKWPCFRLRC